LGDQIVERLVETEPVDREYQSVNRGQCVSSLARSIREEFVAYSTRHVSRLVLMSSMKESVHGTARRFRSS
jgi:hypothetical protein